MSICRASNITQDPSGRKMDGVLCLKMKVDQNTNSITVHRFNCKYIYALTVQCNKTYRSLKEVELSDSR